MISLMQFPQTAFVRYNNAWTVQLRESIIGDSNNHTNGNKRLPLPSNPQSSRLASTNTSLVVPAVKKIALSSPMKIVHLFPLYKVYNCESRFCPYNQELSVAIAAMQRARENAKNATVTLATSVFTEDGDAVPSDFVRLPNLTRSTQSEYQLDKKLPFINDLFDNLRSSPDFSTYDFVIYTNGDIVVHESFYDTVASIIAKHRNDAFTINRLTVAKGGGEIGKKGSFELYTALDLDVIYKLPGIKHPGYDCFVMKREIFEQINMGDIFLGHPPVSPLLMLQLESLAERFKKIPSYTGTHRGTFHLGNDESWKKTKNLKYNKINYENAYDLREMWSAHCTFSINPNKLTKTRRPYVANNKFCKRLGDRFGNRMKLPTGEPRKQGRP
eukprot:CAMPEP_0194418174 /NCGR_PEP_ID=MMETSP0176-20130528/17265_1 /TAXON_ID=216777 /ORGANISM="Proboscia alata, Strain PI-D3" /LENGTH=384 /DNA_ID=CAMNT_0039224457 /DNA_START=213 /DNA_END=1367 /DNA_ORIENTATION=+